MIAIPCSCEICKKRAQAVSQSVAMVFKNCIDKTTLQNTSYRKVLHTTPQMQLVVVSLKPGEEISLEVHAHTTQFIRVERGGVCVRSATTDDCVYDGVSNGNVIPCFRKHRLEAGDSITIPPKTLHTVVAQETGAKLYTIYSPPVHPPGTIQRSPLE